MPIAAPLPPPASPPSGTPAVLRTVDPGVEAPGPLTPTASIDDGQLVLVASAPGVVAGQPFAPDAFRDVVVDAVVALLRGGMDDAYGIFVRQVAERSYLAFMVTPAGNWSLLVVSDGASAPLAGGRLPVEAPFALGLGAANRLTVVAAGPCVTCIVNGFAVGGATVDPRYWAGLAGALLVHLSAEPAEAAVALRWAQVRALLVDQS
jgi:hypothetical protein